MCVHLALRHSLACISCHGGMASPLSAHWGRCQEDSDLPEDFVKYLWCHMMSMVDFGPRLVLWNCLPCCLYVVLDFCVFGIARLFFCFCAMPVWCHINQSINGEMQCCQILDKFCKLSQTLCTLPCWSFDTPNLQVMRCIILLVGNVCTNTTNNQWPRHAVK